MPKKAKVVTAFKGFEAIQNMMPKDEAADLLPGSSFASMLSTVERTADIYDKNGHRLGKGDLREYIADQQAKKRDGEDVSNDIFYFQDLEDNEMYAVTVEYGQFNPHLTMNEQPLPEQDREIILVQPQKAKEAGAEEPPAEAPEIASAKILEAFDAYENAKEALFPEGSQRNWEAASVSYFALLSNLKDEVNVYDKLGQLLDKDAWQNQIIEKQQNALDGNPAQSDTFYLQSNKNESVQFAMTVAYDGKVPTMTMEKQPLSAKEWNDRLAASATEALEEQKEAAKKARRESAADRLLTAWQAVDNFKKSPGMEKRGMDVLSTNTLNRALKDVQNLAFVRDKDGNALHGDEWTNYLTRQQSKCEKGEKVPQDTFYLQCKDNESKMFKLSVDYSKTKPLLKLDKTPIPDKERAAQEETWRVDRNHKEAFAEANIDLADLRARREWIASAPKRLLDAFKGVQSVKKETNFKRPNLDMGVLELRKNLENVQDIATVCDAAGNKLEGDAWLENLAAKQILRASGEKVPKDTFYLTCKDDNSKMFKVTVDYGKNKPKFKIDKTPIYEDERWRLRGEWQKNAAAAQKAAAQQDVVDPNAEDSPEKQNQKEKTAVAAKNLEKGAATEKNAEKVAKNATETVITPSLDERLKAAGKDANGYTEPSWKKYDVNAQKSGTGAVMEMGEMKPLEELAEEPRSALKNLAQELAEKEKEWDEKRSPKERDMDRINKRMNSVMHDEINSSLDENDPDKKAATKEITKNFRRDMLDAAKENDSVRTLVANMEKSSIQALYISYRDDVAKGVDPKLKGVLVESVQKAEAEKAAEKEALNKEVGQLSNSNEYHPIQDDLKEEQQIEEMKINPQVGP